jgi:cell division inhibitor SepF
MGILDSLKKMTRPYDDDEDDFRDFTPTTREAPSAPKSPAQARGDYAGFETRRESNKVVNIHATAQLQVILVKPERYEEAGEIAEHLRERKTVVLNLEQTNKEVARRILDFLSGAAYAQEGKIKKIAVNTFIITPYNVDILGDLIEELENNGVYF